MKKTFFYALLFAFVSIAKAHNAPAIVACSTPTDETFYTSAISEARLQTPNAEEMKPCRREVCDY
jgi:hypothetical protein